MKEYRVFYKDGKYADAVSEGDFNWWAFFFTGLWSLTQRAYKLFLIVLVSSIISMALDSAQPYDSTNYAMILGLVISAIFGFYGNRWKIEYLLKNGYIEGEPIKTTGGVKAARAAAMNIYRNKTEMEAQNA